MNRSGVRNNQYQEQVPSSRGAPGWLLGFLAVAVIVVLVILIGSVRVVDATKACAWVRFGKVIGNAEPGIQFTGFFNKKVCFPYQSLLFQVAGDSNGDGKLESDADDVDWPIETNTKDGLSIGVTYNLTWHVDYQCASEIRLKYAMNKDDLIVRVIKNFGRSVPRDMAPKYDAAHLYGIGRMDLEKDISTDLGPLLASKCVTMDSFSLRDIKFPDGYEAAINDQQIAAENIETERYIAEQAVFKAQATVTNAKAEADSAIESARGQAETIRLLAIADAEALRIKGSAIRENPEMLQLQFFEALKSSNWMILPYDSLQQFLPLDVDK